jgi:EAL domain-containing protein (putative c-di-GMP-specific phosphodiesterase class I)
MAQNMNLQVIAEGVETAEQKHFLESNGCTLFQGFYFSRPMALDAFEEQLHTPNKSARRRNLTQANKV